MPGKNGLNVVRKMQRENLPTRIVLLTAVLDEGELLEAIRLGVQGIVLKKMASPMLLSSIRKVHAGEQWMIEIQSAAQTLEKINVQRGIKESI